MLKFFFDCLRFKSSSLLENLLPYFMILLTICLIVWAFIMYKCLTDLK